MIKTLIYILYFFYFAKRKQFIFVSLLRPEKIEHQIVFSRTSVLPQKVRPYFRVRISASCGDLLLARSLSLRPSERCSRERFWDGPEKRVRVFKNLFCQQAIFWILVSLGKQALGLPDWIQTIHNIKIRLEKIIVVINIQLTTVTYHGPFMIIVRCYNNTADNTVIVFNYSNHCNFCDKSRG